MKLRTIILTAGLAYLGIKNKDSLVSGAKEGFYTIRGAKDNYDQVQTNLERVASFQEPVKELAQDLTYKLRVYQESIAPNITAIKEQVEKIQTTLKAKKS